MREEPLPIDKLVDCQRMITSLSNVQYAGADNLQLKTTRLSTGLTFTSPYDRIRVVFTADSQDNPLAEIGWENDLYIQMPQNEVTDGKTRSFLLYPAVYPVPATITFNWFVISTDTGTITASVI